MESISLLSYLHCNTITPTFSPSDMYLITLSKDKDMDKLSQEKSAIIFKSTLFVAEKSQMIYDVNVHTYINIG
jgi:hypothetical protein